MKNDLVVLTNPLRSNGRTEKIYNDLKCLVEAIGNRLTAGSASKQSFDSNVVPAFNQMGTDLQAAITACGECVQTPVDSRAWDCFQKTHIALCTFVALADKVRAWGRANGNACDRDSMQLWQGLGALHNSLMREGNDVLKRFPHLFPEAKASSGPSGFMEQIMPYACIGGVILALILAAGWLFGKKRRAA